MDENLLILETKHIIQLFARLKKTLNEEIFVEVVQREVDHLMDTKIVIEFYQLLLVNTSGHDVLVGHQVENAGDSSVVDPLDIILEERI